ncbi:L,D-transpeptidase [Lacticaseibacillus porcinae]|uniref:L,D-transpeptidase n=1 Tax=Lacticaseibacillus porcinae TaxID=1123687 RepID=UPI000F7AA156|nr:L,D-transpeptidase [Lacticaseibacillus porcinae]
MQMKWQYFKWFVPIIAVVLIGLFGVRKLVLNAQAAAETERIQQVQAKAKATKQQAAKKLAKQRAAKQKAETIDWHKPSQSIPYPDVNKYPHLEFVVSLAKQRVYLKNDGKTLYTMYASTGMDNATPKGHYAIQAERGTHFFNGQVMVGANYYTSWLDHGKYLFHSVPTDAQGHYIESEAAKLGKEPASHGCVRLSVADAKWIYTNAKVGMAVIIE